MIPIDKIRALTLELMDGDKSRLPRSCLYHAIASRLVLGGQCIIVAGSTQWRFTPKDDGTNATHFSFMWEGMDLEDAMTLFDKGVMPEMHVFNFYQNKLLDCSTKFLPEAAKLIDGLEWDPSLHPPNYLFGDAMGPNQDWLYRPNYDATRLAHSLTQHILSHHLTLN